MRKHSPDWAIWRHMPTLSAIEAISLSLDVDPSLVKCRDDTTWVRSSSDPRQFDHLLPGFADRLRLYRRVHREPLSPAEFASWCHVIGWNMPLELAELAPTPAADEPVPAPADEVDAAIADAAADPSKEDALRGRLEALGVRFVMVGKQAVVVIPDGTTHGASSPLAGLWAALCGLSDRLPKGEGLDHLLRGSGASGGGAPGNSGHSWVATLTPPTSAPTSPGLATNDTRDAQGNWTAKGLEAMRGDRARSMSDTDIGKKYGIRRQRVAQLIGSKTQIRIEQARTKSR